ncbi:hypothetical protein ABW20_dc0102944 [Dactylellina cionopaga]|nr:hypothetical protein ABW20_dc0102944 [Dactylellina cionopaga]
MDWFVYMCQDTIKEWGQNCRDMDFFANSETGKILSEWDIECKKSEDLTVMPNRVPHSGAYDWIGDEPSEPPKWLWDSHTQKTVRASNAILREGYIAISYTWGRYIKRGEWRSIKGVPWKVPDMEPGHGDVLDIIPILSKTPSNRYFWVDVLCINQQDQVEKRQEIGKQGSIFKQAKGIIVWAWTIPSGHDLALAMYHLGTGVLWSLRVPINNIMTGGEVASYKAWKRDRTKQHRESLAAARVLWADPWFSSLWTMQEMVLCPSGLLMAKNGEYCEINKRPLTLAIIGSAINLAQAMMTIRELARDRSSSGPLLHRIWRSLLRQNTPFDDKLDIAKRALRKHWARESIVRGRITMWSAWEEQSSLSICLHANRVNVLNAVTRRKASSRRGEAVLAALKVAPYSGAFDKDGLTTSGLPPSLLNKILKAEGAKLMFNVDHGEFNSFFFSNVLPDARQSFAEPPTPGKKKWYDISSWSIIEDGNLRIPQGSFIQSPEDANIWLILPASTIGSDEKMPMAKASARIESEYQQWLNPSRRSQALGSFQQKAISSVSNKLFSFSGVTNPMSAFQRRTASTLAGEDVPNAVQIRFLPLGWAEEEPDMKMMNMYAKVIPLGQLWYDVIGFRSDQDDIAWGLILASRVDDRVKEQDRRWYKCGMYISKGCIKLQPIEEEKGMIVGQVIETLLEEPSTGT